MPEKNSIGEKIKNLMEIRKLTNEELAENSGVNIELLDKILNDKVIPSLTPLTKIARSLGVRIGTFIDDNTQTGPLIVKKGKSEQVVYFSGDENKTDDSNLEFFSLAAGKIDRNMEPFVIDIKKDITHKHELSSHEGEEFIYVLEGSIELVYGQDKYVLETGDSIYYDSIVSHHLHAYGNEPAKILAVIYTPF